MREPDRLADSDSDSDQYAPVRVADTVHDTEFRAVGLSDLGADPCTNTPTNDTADGDASARPWGRVGARTDR